MKAVARLLLVVLSPVAVYAQNAPTEPDLLYYSITGWSNSTSPAENATYAMVHREVQRLLLDVAERPRSRDYVEKALSGSGVSLSDMVANGSLRSEDGRYWLNFSLLTRRDQEIIRRATEKYSQSLADAMLARRTEIESLLKAYDLQGVDPKEVAFAVLGCMSLDWNGLHLSTTKGYRAASPKRKSGEFYFMAEETGGIALKQIYWGSSNGGYGKYYFTTFGDDSPRLGLADIRRKSSTAAQAMSFEKVAKAIGAMMFELRRGQRTPVSLAKAAQISVSETEAFLNGMESISWVARQGKLYRASIPVLTQVDKPMVAGLLRIGHQVMENWLAENYEPFRSAVRDITPIQQGVRYQQTFDQLWHYLFGIANQKLVEGELFVNPYAEGRPQQGYTAFIYEDGLNLGW